MPQNKKENIKTQKELLNDFQDNWRNYAFQSLLATLSIFASLMFLNIHRHPIIIASIGASTFIIFAMPKSLTAQPKRLIGGHSVGIIIGSLSGLIHCINPFDQMFIYAIAVGFSIFLMVALDMEHPPAAGTALALSVNGFSFTAVLSVLIGVLILSLIKHLLKPALKDLF